MIPNEEHYFAGFVVRDKSLSRLRATCPTFSDRDVPEKLYRIEGLEDHEWMVRKGDYVDFPAEETIETPAFGMAPKKKPGHVLRKIETELFSGLRIVIPRTRDSVETFITGFFLNAISDDISQAKKYVQRVITKLFRTETVRDDEVYLEMCRKSIWYRKQMDHAAYQIVLNEVRNMLGDMNKAGSEKLVNKSIDLYLTWYNQMFLREFYVLGLNKTQAQEAFTWFGNAMQVLEKILTNPLEVVTCSIEQCIDILDRQRVFLTLEGLEEGKRVRALYEDMKRKRALTYTVKSLKELDLTPDIVRKYGFEYNPRSRSLYCAKDMLVETELVDRLVCLLKEGGLEIEMEEDEETEKLDEGQKQGVRNALSEGVSFLLGSPGSGKTYTIRQIVKAIERKQLPYLMCAFTGKAASRMRESVDREASTIHLLLRKPQLSGITTMGEQKEPSVIIIDEVSMLTHQLLLNLLKKTKMGVSSPTLHSKEPPRPKAIIFVGDHQQLQPIDPGCFLVECLHANRLLEKEGCDPLCVQTLQICHRVEEDKALKRNLAQLNQPYRDRLLLRFETDDSFCMYRGDLDVLEKQMTFIQDDGVPVEEMGIVTPYRTNRTEIPDINAMVQRLFFPDAEWIEGTNLYVGCRVMQTVNNHAEGVMNGDEGVVVAAGTYRSQFVVVVRFYFSEDTNETFSIKQGDTTTSFSVSQHRLYYLLGDDSGKKDYVQLAKEKDLLKIKDLEISFCTTVYKYQGSERQVILFYVPSKSHGGFLNYELVNVALSRARKRVIVVGDTPAIERAARKQPERRADHFGWRLAHTLVK